MALELLPLELKTRVYLIHLDWLVQHGAEALFYAEHMLTNLMTGLPPNALPPAY